MLIQRSIQLALISIVMATMSTCEAHAQSGISMSLNDRSLQMESVQSRNRFQQPATIRRTSGIIRLRQESDFEPLENGTLNSQDSLKLESPTIRKPNPFVLEGEQEDSLKPRESDKPIEPPKFDERRFSLDADGTSETQSNVDEPESSADQDDYQLPIVADVHAPISFRPLSNVDQFDSSGLLTNDNDVNSLQTYVDQSTTYSGISAKPFQTKFATWRAPNFYHRPVYLEDRQLERYGNERKMQNVISAAKFIGQIPTIPYQVGQSPPRQRQYSLGLARPGDYAPYFTRNPTRVDRKGAAAQAIATLGIILP